MERMIGVITQVRLNKGYAFLRGIEDKLSRFIYVKDVDPIGDFDTFHEGMQVSFVPAKMDVRQDGKNNGLRALQVRVCR